MRGLSDKFMQDLRPGGPLHPLIERVNGDPDLELFIRDEYLNIYYCGNSILKLSGGVDLAAPYSLHVHPNYLISLGTPKNMDDWLEMLPLIKEGVRNARRTWLAELPAEQHFIFANNRMGHRNVKSEYFVVDRQYVEERSTGGDPANGSDRPDLFAIKWPRDKRRQAAVTPVLIEVKYGLNSDIQKLHEQIRRYHRMLLGDKVKYDQFICTMQDILKQRAELGLFGTESDKLEKVEISTKPSDVEVLVLLVDYNPHSELLNRTRIQLLSLSAELGIRISIAHVGYALWEKDVETLEWKDSHQGTDYFNSSLHSVLDPLFIPPQFVADANEPSADAEPSVAGEILLFRGPIRKAAEEARADYNELGRNAFGDMTAACLSMVLRHEIVHAACHLGRTSEGMRWPFEIMSPTMHETLAEFFKDKDWDDPVSSEISVSAQDLESLCDHWHKMQACLPPNNPYRQHLTLRTKSPQPIRETVHRLVSERLVKNSPAIRVESPDPIEGQRLLLLLDEKSTPLLSTDGEKLGAVRITDTGLLQLLGFADAVSADVPVKLYEEKPGHLRLSLEDQSVPLDLHNLRALRQAMRNQVHLNDHEAETVESLWNVVSSFSDSRVLEVLQQRPWDRIMLIELGQWIEQLLQLEKGTLVECLESIRGESDELPRWIYEDLVEEWGKGTEEEQLMEGWLTKLDGIIAAVNDILEDRAAEIPGIRFFPGMEALGVYHPIKRPATTFAAQPASRFQINGQDYHLSTKLNPFQQKMQIHLIDWKRREITSESGSVGSRLYDAVLPFKAAREMLHIYKPVRTTAQGLSFKLHQHFGHVASSQAACLNLFLPILKNPQLAAKVLRSVFGCDIVSIATDHLNGGYEFEYWGGDAASDAKGLLGDKSDKAGTDSDLAIAYLNGEGGLCLLLIEHKLTEAEFTECGAHKTVRNKGLGAPYNCDASFSQILADSSLCYYTQKKLGYEYWNLTDDNLFPNADANGDCPFKGGTNQLWRNQLLAESLVKSGHYHKVHFSVVKHPDNSHLDATLDRYRALISPTCPFSVHDSNELLKAAEGTQDDELKNWARWYRDVYAVND